MIHGICSPSVIAFVFLLMLITSPSNGPVLFCMLSASSVVCNASGRSAAAGLAPYKKRTPKFSATANVPPGCPTCKKSRPELETVNK